ncbi:DUF1343 domain-containing protein [Paraflavitalea pollutisoli]|uniref:exo-beta-N-acetylmuramidase NamZ family protein n=1 Tax=Paraflavitalea pollutisoli TaxID=3034143 RepID=UPI0023EC8C26|nr:DUF1343 domain-containing protein [Paraflavitalea sp. H1-2-19X]
MNKLWLIIISFSAAFCAALKPAESSTTTSLNTGKFPAWESAQPGSLAVGRGGENAPSSANRIQPGAERLDLYLPLIKGKRVAVFANHTSTIGKDNIVDVLKKKGVTISVIFGPEHGFRGTADAGAKIGNYVDKQTGIPVVSLYGSKHRPSADDLKNVDVLLFDIQDVGTRFYTYISSLQEYMEAAIEHNKPLIILDRPNPNGFYVDGPVLDTAFRSFVGMQPVPVVYGMTIGEYAYMLAGEQWLQHKITATIHIPSSPERAAMQKRTAPTDPKAYSLTIIPCAHYTHNDKYVLPVKPSPNLPDIQSIYWYASTCYFEGTVLSEGRGTTKPFQLFGHPTLPSSLKSFTPRSMPGATKPKLMDQLCYGWDLSGTPAQVLDRVHNQVQIGYLLEAYRLFPNKDSFFLNKGNFFNKLVGNDELIRQMKGGVAEAEIRKSWEPALGRFKAIRKKYLIYTDFQ